VENHQEFTRYKFSRKLDKAPQDDPFINSPLELLPEGWLEALPGEMLVALNICILPYPEQTSHRGLADEYGRFFDSTALTGSQVGRSVNLALTDFRIGENGMTRMLIFSRPGLPRRSAG